MQHLELMNGYMDQQEYTERLLEDIKKRIDDTEGEIMKKYDEEELELENLQTSYRSDRNC